MDDLLQLALMIPLILVLMVILELCGIDVFDKIKAVFTRKKWRIKELGGFFGDTNEYFDYREDAERHMKEHLPRGGIMSQAIHDKLFERKGWFSWRLIGCYIRDTKYTKDENGEDVAETLDDIVMACEHVKQHLDILDKEGKRTCNKMFGIRASWLRTFCVKGCRLNPFTEGRVL